MRRPRVLLLGLHRYVGLSLAAFLLLAGPTGSVAAFHDALDARLNPDLFEARTVGAPLPVGMIAQLLAQQIPDGRLGYMVYRPAPGETVRAFLQPAPGRTLLQNEVFLDPPTGTVQGARDSEGCCFGRRTLIPFLYRFHYSLGLGRTGILVMGIVSLVWAMDCVVGLLLTLPVRWIPWRLDGWRRWSLAWRIDPRKGGIRRAFDLHRALSLWLWIVLLGIAISGVSLNLPTQVFQPIVSALLPLSTPAHMSVAPATCQAPIGLNAADGIARTVAASIGWPAPPRALFVLGGGKTRFYFGDANGRRAAGLGGPVITLDAVGNVLRVDRPGGGRAGDVVLAVQFPWHSGAIAGLAGRVLVAASGLVVPVLVITGIVIWNRKRRPRRRPHPVATRKGVVRPS